MRASVPGRASLGYPSDPLADRPCASSSSVSGTKGLLVFPTVFLWVLPLYLMGAQAGATIAGEPLWEPEQLTRCASGQRRHLPGRQPSTQAATTAPEPWKPPPRPPEELLLCGQARGGLCVLRPRSRHPTFASEDLGRGCPLRRPVWELELECPKAKAGALTHSSR